MGQDGTLWQTSHRKGVCGPRQVPREHANFLKVPFNNLIARGASLSAHVTVAGPGT